MRDAIRKTERWECLVVIMEERRREMDAKKWQDFGSRIAEPLKQIEKIAEQMGVSMVHTTFHGTNKGTRAFACICENGEWFYMNYRGNRIEISKGNEKSYYTIS